MMKFAMEAPWYTWQKKIKALFERDPDITVGDIYDSESDKLDFVFDIEVRSHEKFLALDRVLPKVKTFGNVTLGICLYDEENANAVDAGIELYQTLFKGNPIVKDIKDVIDQAGVHHGFVRFQPEVIQFFDDDLSDYEGNWSGLAQDIAREVFENDYRGINFCTASKAEENGNPLEESL